MITTFIGNRVILGISLDFVVKITPNHRNHKVFSEDSEQESELSLH